VSVLASCVSLWVSLGLSLSQCVVLIVKSKEKMIERMMNTGDQPLKSKTIYCFAGGKGGVGKTLVTANLGIALAQRLIQTGERVVIIDNDLGCSDLQFCLGLKYPDRSLHDFFCSNETSLADLCLDTPVDGLQIIAGASDIRGQVELSYFQRQRLIEQIKSLDASFILVDLGAGTSFHVVDCFLLAGQGILVVTPEPTSLQNAYGLMKVSLYRKLAKRFYDRKEFVELISIAINPAHVERIQSVEEFLNRTRQLDAALGDQVAFAIDRFRPGLIFNMVKENDDQIIEEKFMKLVGKYLGINLGSLGSIHFDDNVTNSIKNKQPFLLTFPRSKAADDFRDMANTIMTNHQTLDDETDSSSSKRIVENLKPSAIGA